MATRNFQRVFRAAAWKDEAEVEAFIQQNLDVTEGQIREIINVLIRDTHKYTHAQLTAMERVASFLAVAKNDLGLCPFLIEACRSSDERFRRVAAEILIQLNDPSWHPRMFDFLREKDERLRNLARAVLSKTGGKTIFQMFQASLDQHWPSRLEGIDTLVQVSGHYAIPVLEQMLPNLEKNERVRVAQVLADEAFMKAAHMDAARVLVVMLDDRDPMVRGRATAGLGVMGDESHAGRLSDLVWDDNQWVVKAAIGALGRLGTAEAIDALGEAARVENISVQTAVADALLEIGTDDAIPTLVGLLESPNVVVRNKATEGLVSMGKQQRVDMARMLVLMMNSPDVQVRRAVIEIINEIGDPDGTLWKRLVRHLRDEDWWVRERATEVLVNISGTEITDHIIGLLTDESDIVRRYAVEVLIRLKNPSAVGPLAKAAKEDTDWWVVERAVEALGELGDKRATPVVVNLLERPELQWVCVEALSKLTDPRAIRYLGQLLERSVGDFRIAVLGALESIGTPEIVPEVRKVADDLDGEVRNRAFQILSKFDIEMDRSALEQQVAESLSFIDSLLEEAKNRGATDLFIVAGERPQMKLLGKVQPISDEALSPDETLQIARAILSEKKIGEFEARRDVDTSYESQNEHYRFRVNVYKQRAGVNIVFRVIADEVLAFEKLNLPDKVLEFTTFHSGLVIIAGPSNSGKSTTLTTLIDHINRTQARHIITLEDPIEYAHAKTFNCLVNQREIGTHTHDFKSALRSVLREDPDVILVGEMRDEETIGFAVTAAETGHLVFGTLHTISAATTIDRIVDAFPSHQQPQIRVMISESLRGVLCQQLLMKPDGKGRVLAVELMYNNHAISNMVRQGKIHQIPSVITTSYEQGMRLMDREMLMLANKGVITPEEAYAKATDRKLFAHFFEEEEAEEEGAKEPNRHATN